MWKQLSLAGVLAGGLAVGGYLLISRARSGRAAPSGPTVAPAAAARQWLRTHGYLDENGRLDPQKKPGS
jgi:hypothetical protein